MGKSRPGLRKVPTKRAQPPLPASPAPSAAKMRPALRLLNELPRPRLRHASDTPAPMRPAPSLETNLRRIDRLFSKPTWSVSSLLPPEVPTSTPITREKLNHLLRLSALPPPANTAAAMEMLDSLHQHLHFVEAAQAVDTTDVMPLQRIGDLIGMEPLKWMDLTAEDPDVGDKGRIEWTPMKLPKKEVAGFYVVDGKATEELDVESDGIPFM